MRVRVEYVALPCCDPSVSPSDAPVLSGSTRQLSRSPPGWVAAWPCAGKVRTPSRPTEATWYTRSPYSLRHHLNRVNLRVFDTYIAGPCIVRSIPSDQPCLKTGRRSAPSRITMTIATIRLSPKTSEAGLQPSNRILLHQKIYERTWRSRVPNLYLQNSRCVRMLRPVGYRSRTMKTPSHLLPRLKQSRYPLLLH